MSGYALGDGERKFCHKLCSFFMMMPEPAKFPSEVKSALSHFDSDAYSHDFGTSDSSYDFSGDVPKYKAEKIAIVLLTLNFQKNLLIFQLGLLMVFRFVFLIIHQQGEVANGADQQHLQATGMAGIFNLLKTTLLERSLGSYTDTIEGHVYHSVNSTALMVNTFWGMI